MEKVMTLKTYTFRMIMAMALSAALVVMTPGMGLTIDYETGNADGVKREWSETPGPEGMVASDFNNKNVSDAQERDISSAGDPRAEEPRATDVDANQKMTDATIALQEMFNLPITERIPPELIQNAKALAVFPGVTKAGFIVGGRYGDGVLMVKDAEQWSGPLFLSLYGASIGAQIGLERSDLVMVFVGPETLAQLQDGSLEFGTEASVAVGPYGDKATTSSKGDIYAYQETAGGFAGLALTSGYIKINTQANDQYFGKVEGDTRAYYPTPDEMISGKKAPETEGAAQLIRILDEYETR